MDDALKSVAFHTLGCKLNFAETSAMRKTFEGGSYEIRPFGAVADVYVINTCSVTEDADKDCRKAVRRALRTNPDAVVAVTGCYAQLAPRQIADIDGVSLVVGAKAKFDLPALLRDLDRRPAEAVVHRTDVNEAVDFHHALSSGDRTRAFLKIQDGCDYSCAFCTIPLARGKSRSPLIGDVVAQARLAVEQGFQEIILTGVNAGDFGRYTGQSLYDLLVALEQVDGIARIRFSSVEPNLMEDRIIDLAAESARIMPHFHMPIQSGSDALLRLMRRRYKSDLYRQRVDHIRRVLPHAAIGVDVITGHPGETDALFRESFDFLDRLEVSYLHVFTYSERPNTHALTLEPVVPVEERRQRTHALRRLSEHKRDAFEARFVGTVRPVLFEEEVKDGHIAGYTDNYIRVRAAWRPEWVNRIVPVHLTNRTLEGVFDVG